VRLPSNGLEAWQQVLPAVYEGLIGRDPASPYRGGRTLSWLKVKRDVAAYTRRVAEDHHHECLARCPST